MMDEQEYLELLQEARKKVRPRQQGLDMVMKRLGVLDFAEPVLWLRDCWMRHHKILFDGDRGDFGDDNACTLRQRKIKLKTSKPKIGQYYQQGDVLLKRIAALPKGLKQLDTKVLQEGEFTGHMHQFRMTDDLTVYAAPALAGASTKTITENENKYLEVRAPSCLSHEEHKPIVVPPGIYQIDIRREYDYDLLEARRVQD